MAAPAPVFSGVVTQDVQLLLDARGLFRAHLKRLAGKRVRVTVKAEARPKSRSQLGYLFAAVYPVIAEELGYREYEVTEVHDAVARTLRGLKPEPNPLQLRWSLAEQDHEEVSRYIEDVRHWALTEYGIVTPDADAVEAA